MNKLLLLLVFLFAFTVVLVAQEMTLDPSQYVNIQILADTLADGSQAHSVYKVESGNFYAFDGTMFFDFDLVIEGPDNGWIYDDATPPVFVQTAPDGGNTHGLEFFNLRDGASITVKNILFTGLLSVDLNCYTFIQNAAGDTIIADNCVFSDYDSHALKITGAANKVSITNSIFMNGLRRRDNLYGGMMSRFDGAVDEILLENNTVVNCARTMGNGGRFLTSTLHEVHNTYLNELLSAHETRWSEGIQANNIFYNWNWIGQIPGTTHPYEAYFTTYAQFANEETNLDSIALYNGRNLFFRQQAFQDYYDDQLASAGVEAGLLWSIDIDSIINGDTNFTIGKNYGQNDPVFVNNPDNLDEMLAFLSLHWVEGTWGEATDWRITSAVTFNDEGQPVLNWPPAFDLTVTNDSLLIAGTDGLPVGDLNWFPDAKATYLANRDTYIAALQDSIENATDVYDPDVAGSEFTPPPAPQAIEDFINGPNEYSLSHNYPNPFNPTTSIAFKLDKTGDISMKIYDITGRLVKTVIDNQKYTTGPHIVTIDMVHYSSGVYFTVLNNGSQKLVRKMMLVK